MLQTFRKAFQIEDIRRKILYTLAMLFVVRLGSQLPTPGVDPTYIQNFFANQTGDSFNFFNAFTGGSFETMSIFALSITPYITSSIIMQLMTIAIPKLEEMQKEGEDGRKKIAEYTRYLTVALALFQSSAMAIGFGKQGLLYEDAQNVWGYMTVIAAMTAGSALLMWIGERITEKGVGNGISIVLLINIVSSLPQDVLMLYERFMAGKSVAVATVAAIIVLAVVVATVVFVLVLNGAERRIPVQYAKKVVGRKVYGGQSTFLPIKVTMSGVMPVIFASAILSIPSTIRLFVGEPTGFWKGFFNAFSSTGWLYSVLYLLLIVVFAYFYMTIQYNPIEMANNLRTNNGTIPGIRPGRPTAEFISKILSKITLIGAIFLAFVAILPILYSNLTGMYGLSMGGTSVIIMVGVALETVKQIESQMMMRHYKGFLD